MSKARAGVRACSRTTMASSDRTRASDRAVYMVAFDHRRSLRRALSAIGADTAPAHLSDLKLIIWRGLKTALPHVAADAEVAVLIDRGNERIGRQANSAGVRVALALEESGGDTLRPDAAAVLLDQELRALSEPIGKALLRWHPDDPEARKRQQLAALRQISDVVSGCDADFLLELLIHPRPPDGTDGRSSRLHTDSVLAGLQRAAAEEILSAGISPAWWKMEGHSNAQEAARLDALVASARQDAAILILGGGSGIGGLRQAFSCRDGNERYRGFAVGRSIWQEPILALCNHETTETEAEAKIGGNFLAVVDAFESGDPNPVGEFLRKGVVPSRGSSPGLRPQQSAEERTGGRATCA